MSKPKLKLELSPYQIVGRDFLIDHKYTMLADQMGCLAGDTPIKVNRAGGSKKYSLEAAYHRFHNSWDPNIPSKIRSFNGQNIQLNEIKNILSSGLKDVYLLKLENGFTVSLTSDHEVLTRTGFISAKDLTNTSEVMVDILKRHQKKNISKKSKKKKSRYPVLQIGRYYPYGHLVTVNKKRVRKVEKHRIIFESRLNGLGLEEFRDKTYDEREAKKLKYVDPQIFHIHHKNGDPKDNSKGNLEKLTKEDHWKRHAGYSKFGHGEPQYSKVSSFTFLKRTNTYDIVCNDPHRNFVANGIVVHNCGKTPQVIATAAELNTPFLVVCPACLKNNWANEIDKFVDNPPEHDIISYAAVAKNEELFKKYPYIAFDESHYLKNTEAKRTLATHHYVQKHKPEYLTLCSGTPIKNRVPEFYSPLKLMSYIPDGFNGDKLTANYYQFCNTFSHARRKTINGMTFTEYEGTRNIPMLKQLLKHKWIRRHAADVLDLPEISETFHSLNKKDTVELENRWHSYLDGGKLTDRMSESKAKNAELKAKATADYVKVLLGNGEPIVIFTDHLKSAAILGEKIKGSKVATGQVPTIKRAEMVADFQAGKLDCLICTYGAMSEGHNIYRASNVVLNDLPWVPTTLEQAIKRIHRRGQTRKCLVHVVKWGPLDEMIYKNLQKKIAVLSKVIG